MMPLKPPLLMVRMVSPDFASLTTASSIWSKSWKTCRGTGAPSASSSVFQGRSCGAKTNAMSDYSREPARVFRCTPSFMVLERGSRTAMSLASFPIFSRSPWMVVLMAVGWWAKSS